MKILRTINSQTAKKDTLQQYYCNVPFALKQIIRTGTCRVIVRLNNHCKNNCFPIRTVHRNLTAMRLHDSLSHGQPDSCASGVSGSGFVRTVKTVEQALQIRYPLKLTGVKYLHADSIVAAVNIQPDFAALIGVFQCVVQKNVA